MIFGPGTVNLVGSSEAVERGAYRRALEEENECAREMAENAGDKDEPDDFLVDLVRLAQDAEVG